LYITQKVNCAGLTKYLYNLFYFLLIMSHKEKKDQKGITADREKDFGEWYAQILQKAELIDYSPVSGCYILRPASYEMWEKVQAYFDMVLKEDGVRNAYFPLFIPESLLSKEASHVKGFTPEVAWVETGGKSKLSERLAVRPTSETIMYDAYAKWIRSYKDLPLRLNQWCNVVRWEFKHPMPFLRSREFLWQEGHTVFATKAEAVSEAKKILGFYERLFREMYAVPVLAGQKSEAEKFPGAEFTFSVEAFASNGKAIQAATSHYLGQHFSKAFDITFVDENQKKQYAWQNSWGVSTRSIGAMILVHADEKGLVLPPKVASRPVVIVPIIFDDTKSAILKEAKSIQEKLKKKGITAYIDDREGYTPGWKFNEWELKGVPLRIEIGPKDLAKKQVMVARRDSGEKQALMLAGVEKEVELLLQQIQKDMYAKAEKLLNSSIVKVENIKEAQKAFEDKKMAFAAWCTNPSCEEEIKAKMGVKSLNSPLEQPVLKKGQLCFACKNVAQRWFYVGRSY